MNLRKFFSNHGPLSEVVGDGYRQRDEQVKLATLAMQTLNGGGAGLLADAPTGTGKSFSYLCPAALTGRRVVVSTATKNLQLQLLVKELPTVCAAMEAVGLEPPTYGLLKGRSNYLCQSRHDSFLKEPTLTNTATLEQLNAWRNATRTGDVETLTIPKPAFWADIASDGDDCHRKSCAYAVDCFYYTAKERVQNERRAYDLEQYVRDARENADKFFDNLDNHRTLHSYRHAPAGYADLIKDLESLTNLVAANPKEEVNKLEAMLEKLASDLGHFYDPPLDTHAYAVEGSKPPALKSWLVCPGEVFREKILERDEATLLTSATLAVGRKFEYPRKRLGFDKFRGPVAEFQGREIFDYEHNALCYVADDLPVPRGAAVEAHTQAVILRAGELVRVSRGRALILLATHKALRSFVDANFGEKVAPYPV